MFLGFCVIHSIPLRICFPVFHANGYPFAVFIEQEIIQCPAIFRVFYPLFPDEMFKIVLSGKFPIKLGHVEKSIFVLLPVGNEPGQGCGIGQNKRIFPVYEYRTVPGTKAH